MPDTKSKNKNDQQSAAGLTPDQFMSGQSTPPPGQTDLTPDQFMSDQSEQTGDKKSRRGSDSDAADKIQAILNGRDYKDLSISEQMQILSVGFAEYARRHAKKGQEEKSWLKKLLDYVETAAGVQGDVSTRIAGAATDPKNILIGATGLVSPAIPSAYFFFEGASRLPGEARKAKKDPSYENLLNVGLTATQVVGSGAGMTEGMKPGEKPSAADKTGTKPGIVQRIGQRMVGTGPRMAEKAVREEERRVAAAPEAVDEIKARAKEAIDKKNEDYDAKIADIHKRYANDVAERERQIAKAESDHAIAVADELEAYQRRVAESSHESKGEAMIEAHRRKLTTQSSSLSDTVQNNVRNTHDLVRGSLDERWNTLRDKIGNDRPVIAPPIYQAVEAGRAMLAGVPADLKIFNDIIKEITEKDAEVEGESGGIGHPGSKVPKTSIPFGDARIQYSAIGEKAFAAEGNVRRALMSVYEAYDAAIGQTARGAGQLEIYSALKADWSQYMRDWHDMSAMATGGSPLARLYRATDQGVITGIITSKNFADRLLTTFKSYARYGASPESLAKLRDTDMELKSLPKPRFVPPATAPNVPDRPVPPAPVTPPVEDIQGVEAKRSRDLRRLEAAKASKIDKAMRAKTPDEMLKGLQDAKQDRAADRLDKLSTIGRHDLIMGSVALLGAGLAGHVGYALIYLPLRFGELAAANSKKFEEVLSRVTDRDVDTINQMYERNPAMKAEGQKALADVLIERAKAGKPPVKLSILGKFLSPAEMGRVLRAYVKSAPKNQQPPVTEAPPDIAPPPASPVQVTTGGAAQ